ncbi:MAG: BACON domain-containing protein [Rikenellaceae bacterium]|nr:BACON domain-containing protein [Rikenellaceae bacterium]
MKNRLWTMLSFMTVMLLSAVSFTACVDDNDDVGMPYLELDIEEVPLTLEGGSATFTLKTNRPWTATLGEESDWISVSPAEGVGTTEIELVVPASSYGRVGEVNFHLSNTYATYETKSIQIKQGDVEEEVVIYSETVGTTSVSSPYPYADTYEGWATEGTGASTVTYGGKSASIRATGLANAGSGPNVIFFGTLPAYLQVNTITLQPNQSRLQLSFLGSFSYKPEGASDYDNSFNFEKFTVEISGDGQKWSKLDLTKDNGDAEYPYWISAQSQFILKEVPEQLSIRFTALQASAFRLDDIKLSTFNGTAPEIDLAQGEEGGSTGGGETPEVGDKIFYESFGTPVKGDNGYWPYVTENAANIMQGTGVVAGTTTYAGYNTSARTVGTYTAPNPPASGEGHVWFPAGKTADKNYFEVQKLALNGQKNLDFSFYLHGNTDPYTAGDVILELSADGQSWSKVDFTVAAISGVETTWQVATASITLKEAPEHFYAKWSSATTNGCRMDDPTIAPGNGGTEIDLAAGTGGEEPEPEDPVESEFAGQYLIVANNGGTYVAASPLAADKSYGYLSPTTLTVANNQVAADSASSALAWTVAATSTEGQFTLKGADGRYYYMSGSYNSFNVSAEVGTEGYTWSFTKADDGTYAITNIAKGKTMQYDTQYNSYGAYSDTRGLATDIYKLNAEGTAFVKVSAEDEGGSTPAVDSFAGKYLMVAISDSFQRAAKALDSSKTYGYLPYADVTVANKAIAADATTNALAWTIGATATEGQYTILGADSRYYYQSGSYNSFNVSAEVGTDGYNWTFTANEDGTYTVKNVAMGKTVQYDTQYNSYGSYADIKGVLVTLFKLNDAGTAYEQVSDGSTGDGGGTGEGDGGEGGDPTPSTGGGQDDFATLNTATSYTSQTTTAGWVGENCAVQSGGSADSNPKFKSLLGTDESVRGMVMNGKTSAVGKITSPTLTGGCGTLSFNYGYAFSESKGVSFKVEIMQNGSVVKSFEVNNTSAAKLEKCTFSEAVDVAGDFQLVFTNNSPSKSTSNKDRYTIFNIQWTGKN